ncbi:oxidoreductase [Gemmatimonadetes bacterium T265]|nr:oxidoreductase [Gemmatimonadetes bacterium T265]
MPTGPATALVTGASRGIGRAVAGRLAASGVLVAALARTAAALADLARAHPDGRVVPLAADLRDVGATARAVAAARTACGGAPDLLVNNAGVFAVAPAHETDADAFAAVLDANLAAPFRLVRALLPEMRARGAGHVVTIGSVADRSVFPGNAAYAASKYGLRALHEVLRAECRGTGVRCTLVSPGPVDTPLWDSLDPDHTEGFTPRAAMLAADDVADAVLYVATRRPEVNVDELRLGRA